MPFYTYHCSECDTTWEGFQRIAERHLELCKDCGSTSTIIPSYRGPRAFREYYDTSLGMTIRSRRHKRSVLQKKGLVEVGNEDIPTKEPKRKPILTDKELHQAWNEFKNLGKESSDV